MKNLSGARSDDGKLTEFSQSDRDLVEARKAPRIRTNTAN
jgi:hypothetical protein